MGPRDLSGKDTPSSGQTWGRQLYAAHPTADNTATPSFYVRGIGLACHVHGPPNVKNLNFPLPAESLGFLTSSTVLPMSLPSHFGSPLKQRPPALTSFQCGGRIGTYRCARTVAAPAQTQGPAAPARPGGSSAGHSSVPAGGGKW